MNNDAHRILVSAIASHGEKLATIDAYCKVYLAGYMVDYADEKQLLTLLRQLELSDMLLAHRQSEVSDSDVYNFIKALEFKHSYNQRDFAWGVDAWAAALSVPDIMRREIRKHCFPLISQQLNSDLEPVADVIDRASEQVEEILPEDNSLEKKRNVLLPFAAMVLLGLTTAHFAVGSVPMEKNGPMVMVPLNMPKVVSPSILSEESKVTNTALHDLVKTEKAPESRLVTLKPSGKQGHALTTTRTGHPLASQRSHVDLAQLKVSAKPIQKSKVQAVPDAEVAVKNWHLDLNAAVKTQRTQRLNADIEAFLKQEH